MAQIRIKPKKIIEEYIKVLRPAIEVKEAILFGSWAAGKGRLDSDIDLIIISSDFKRMDFMDRLILLSKMRGRRFMTPAMDVLGYTSREFAMLSKESAVLSEAKEKGEIIYKS